MAEAAKARPGSDSLFFMPYLTGERLGRHRNARAQYFGLGASHGLPELQRATMEGVAFAAARHLRIMEAASGRPMERVIASGGGAKTELWLKIKASIYGVPIVVPERGRMRPRRMRGPGPDRRTGGSAVLDDAVRAMVRFTAEITPDAAWSDTYGRMQPVFDRLYAHSQALYDDLDALGPPSDPGQIGTLSANAEVV